MDGVSILDLVLKVAANLGLPGIVLLIWYFSDKDNKATLTQYREDMIEIRQMYVNNVELVKGYQGLAEGLQSLIVLNTQTITRLCDKIDANQYCPNVRLKKEATGRQG